MKKNNLIVIIIMAVMLIGIAATTDPTIAETKTYVDVHAIYWAAEPIKDM